MKLSVVEKISTVLLLVMLLAASVAQNGTLFGNKPNEWFADDEQEIEIVPPTLQQLRAAGFHENSFVRLDREGIWNIRIGPNVVGKVIATLEFNRKTYGFAGPIPMYLFLNPDNSIAHITMLENSEDQEFLSSALKKGVISQWQGLKVQAALDLKPDAITGATMSSKAINTSIERALFALENETTEMAESGIMLTFKDYLALLALAVGLCISYCTKKYPKLRPALMIINCVVLGFWCGKFISFATLLGYVEHGISLQANIIGIVLLLLAVVMPLVFNKKAYYCTWVCPFGASQELAGKLMKPKKIPPKLLNVLKHTQNYITIGLFTAMWLGVSTTITGYEPFAALLFQHASIVVIIIASLSLIGSLFTPRPWCRFACPTGKILRWMENFK